MLLAGLGCGVLAVPPAGADEVEAGAMASAADYLKAMAAGVAEQLCLGAACSRAAQEAERAAIAEPGSEVEPDAGSESEAAAASVPPDAAPMPVPALALDVGAGTGAAPGDSPAGRVLRPNTLDIQVGPASGTGADGEVQAHLAAFSADVEQGRLADAQARLDALALRLPARSLTLLRARAWLAMARADHGLARTLYTQLVERVPDDRNASLNLAVLDARTGDAEAALERLARLDAGRPGSADATHLARAVDRLRHDAAIVLEGAEAGLR